MPNATPCASPALVFRGPISLARTLAPAACGAPACCSRPSGTAAARCTATAPSNAPPRPSPCHLGSIMSSGNNAMICKALYATLQISIRSCGAVERIAGRTKPPPPKTQPSAVCKLLWLLYRNQALLCLAPSSKIRRCKSKTSKYSVGRTFTARAPLILFSLRRFSACLRVTTVERGCQPIPGLLALLRKAIRRTLPIRHGKRLEPCTAPPESDATWKRTTSAFCRENTRHIPLTNLPH